MDKFSINYSELEADLSRPKYYKYEDVKDRLIRVAYDVVKFQDANEDIDGLWKIETTDDGEVIVAMYEPPSEDKESIKSESSWAVMANNAFIDVFYKGDTIYRIASANVNVPPEEVPAFCDNVANKLNTSDDFKRSLLDDLSDNDRASLFSKYPELT